MLFLLGLTFAIQASHFSVKIAIFVTVACHFRCTIAILDLSIFSPVALQFGFDLAILSPIAHQFYLALVTFCVSSSSFSP